MSELVKRENAFVVPSFGDIKKNIAENFEGLTPTFINVKFPSAGGTVFEIGDEAVKSIEGVIVSHYAIRLLFLKKFGEGEAEMPACISQDGIRGQGLGEEVGSGLCHECPYNQWGSYKELIDEKDETNKKACQEKHRVFILQKGAILPVLLTLPVTSIREFATYITLIASRGLNYKQVITQVYLEKAVNKRGIAYSKAKFRNVRQLTDEEYETVSKIATFLTPYCKQKPIEQDEMKEE